MISYWAINSAVFRQIDAFNGGAAKAQPQMVAVLSMWANIGVAELGGRFSVRRLT